MLERGDKMIRINQTVNDTRHAKLGL